MTTGNHTAAPDIFYPIVPDVAWLERLAPLGIRTVQLRLKHDDPDEIRCQIIASLDLAQRHRIQLIVNDHWQAAIETGADYVHLGQEDLAAADLDKIRAAGIRLGISTHDEAELEIALAAGPDYIALGPIWETKLKAMKWAPQGLDRVTTWARHIAGIPLVAIGGITPERAPDVIAAGAKSVAVITDYITHPDPEGRIRTWLDWAKSART